MAPRNARHATRKQQTSLEMLQAMCSSVSHEALQLALSNISESAASDVLQALNSAALLKPMTPDKKNGSSSKSGRVAKSTGKRQSGKGNKIDGQSEEEDDQADDPDEPEQPPSDQDDAPQDPSLVKQAGKITVNNSRVPAIPQNVLGGILNQFPTLASSTHKGLYNPLNMCYRNSVLQALFHTPGFYRYLGKMHKDCALRQDKCVVCALQRLARVYWHNAALRPFAPDRVPGPNTDLALFTRACKAQLPISDLDPLRDEMRYDLMSDAHDFLQYLFNHIRGAELPSDDTAFAGMFDLSTEQSWTCGTCGKKSTLAIEAPSVGLEVNVREGEGSSLIELIRQFSFSEPRFLHCENSAKCRRMYQAAKEEQSRKRLKSLPDGPTRKGEEPDAETGELPEFKVFDKVAFKEHLDLSEFTQNKQAAMYRLDGVVAHLGEDIESGHYIASVRNSHGKGYSVINDDVSAGKSEGGGRFGEMNNPRTIDGEVGEPYILIYSKVAKD